MGENVVKTDKCMGVSQLLAAHPGCPPKVYAYDVCTDLLRICANAFAIFVLTL